MPMNIEETAVLEIPFWGGVYMLHQGFELHDIESYLKLL